MASAASGALLRWGVFPLLSIMTRSTTARKGTSMDVTYSGRASVHHRMDTAASKARQFCLGGSSKIGTAAGQEASLSAAPAAVSGLHTSDAASRRSPVIVQARAYIGGRTHTGVSGGASVLTQEDSKCYSCQKDHKVLSVALEPGRQAWCKILYRC